MYEDDTYNFLSMFDGICDQARELKKLSGKMPHNETWVFSTSSRHMFVDFTTSLHSSQGFSANIHFGNEIKNSKVFEQKGELLNFKANIDPMALLSQVKSS